MGGTPEKRRRVSARELGFDERRLGRLSAVTRGYTDRGQAAGTVTAVVRRGQIAFLEAQGVQDLETRVPMAEDTLFRVYSMTKPITSAAVMMLVEETAVRLTDPVSRFFPEFAQMEVYLAGDDRPFRTERARREITVRDLLTHTSGLAYGIGDEHPVEKLIEREFWADLASEPEMSLADMARRIADYPLVHQPGTHWRYSVSIDLLGAIVEAAAGVPFEEFLRKRLFEPLGMADTFFTVPEGKRSRLAGVYTPTGEGLSPASDPPTLGFTAPNRHPNGGGGLVSTIGDYLAFTSLLRNRGLATADGRGERLLGSRTVSMMMTDHLPRPLEGWQTPGVGFGYGGSVVTDPGQLGEYASIGRFSWGGAASTVFWYDPVEDLEVVIMQQIVPGFVHRLTDDVYATVYQALVD